MNKLSKILWKIFTCMAVFFCCNSVNAAASNSTETRTSYNGAHVLCRAGYYVSKCGDYTVGTNWLKGYPESENTVLINATTEARAGVSSPALISGVVNSPNYYDYSGINNLKNLRYFFSDDANAKIIYITSSGTRQLVEYSTYKDIRNDLLTAICNPVNVQISCSPCPGMATVPASTVRISSDSGLLIADSWNFHTIADCYMQEFADSTGIFEYVDNYQDNNTQNCYYANDVAGDVLIRENTATNSQYD